MEPLQKQNDGEKKFVPGTKVTVIEDDKFLADLIVKKLTTEGCKVSYTNTGENAVALVKAEMPEIIISDILLPGIDGYEVISRIKQDPALKNIPVIFLSNLQSKEDFEKGKQLGVNTFLVKSLMNLDEILSETRKVLDASKAQAPHA